MDLNDLFFFFGGGGWKGSSKYGIDCAEKFCWEIVNTDSEITKKLQ